MSAPRADRALLRRCFAAAIAAAEPGAAVHRHLRRAPGSVIAGEFRLALADDARVVLVAAGKAAAGMATALADGLDHCLERAVVVTKHGHAGALADADGQRAPRGRLAAAPMRLVIAGHPVPDAGSQAAAAAALAAVRGLRADDLVVVGLSGGASALLAAPRPPLTLADKQAATAALVACGADIHAVNCVRRRLSLIKGGGLARAAAPARVLTLAISDVPGDAWPTIGSGPTVPAVDDAGAALAVVERFGIAARLPPAALALLRDDAARPAPAAITDDGARVLIASNADAVAAALVAARAAVHDAAAWDRPLTGEAARCAAGFVDALLARRRAGWSGVLVAGGETTVTLGDAPGRGGRNQEFALAAARALHAAGAAADGMSVLAAGTDGGDGPTDAAGAIADAGTVARAAALGLDAGDHLRRHDAYPLFDALGDLVRTGPTGTNVMDVVIAVVR